MFMEARGDYFFVRGKDGTGCAESLLDQIITFTRPEDKSGGAQNACQGAGGSHNRDRSAFVFDGITRAGIDDVPVASSIDDAVAEVVSGGCDG